MTNRWRCGRSVGRTLYLDGNLAGLMDTKEMASAVVRALNDAKTAESTEATIAELQARYDKLSELIAATVADAVRVESERCIRCVANEQDKANNAGEWALAERIARSIWPKAEATTAKASRYACMANPWCRLLAKHDGLCEVDGTMEIVVQAKASDDESFVMPGPDCIGDNHQPGCRKAKASEPAVCGRCDGRGFVEMHVSDVDVERFQCPACRPANKPTGETR